MNITTRCGICALKICLAALVTAACSQSNAPSDSSAAQPAQSPPSSCLLTTDDTRFANADRLYSLNQTLAGFGDRPTGGTHHQAYYQWLKTQVSAVPGLRISELPYDINLWTPTLAALDAGNSIATLGNVPVSGPVPYALATADAGSSGALVYIPAGTVIAGNNVAGKIVLRDAETSSIPLADLTLVSWFVFDPDLTIALNASSNYERDAGGYNLRIADLKDAAAGGAAGLIFIHSFPRDQVAGHYAPYEGLRWGVPALYVGADEGTKLKQLAQSGGVARIRMSNADAPTQVHTLVATLPGQSDERIVIESHTDGMNGVWDNGPLVMLEMARYFSGLGQSCRPKTLQFVFTTAHIYQQLFPPKRHGGAGQFAKMLDDEYDQGKIDYVLALEHFGALEYNAVPRSDGGPGRELVQSGLPEINTIFISDSPALVAATAAVVAKRAIPRTFGMHGASLPGATLPPFRDFGGEGTPYQEHALPTVGFITGPWSLYNPAFGMEAIDKNLMLKQALAYTDLIHLTAPLPRELLAGGVLAERIARSVACAAGQTSIGDCPGNITDPPP